MPSSSESTFMALMSMIAVSGVAAQATQTISFAASKPSGAVTVPANFVGFGFETSSYNNYTTEFSQNLINSVAKRMSTPPTIRIGGTTGDRVRYDPGQTENITCVGDGCIYDSTTSFVLGPSYFDGFTSFKPNLLSFQAPLGNPLNVSNTLDFVSMAYSKLGADRLAAIAIGNEPDSTGYEATAQDYVTNALNLQNHIVSNLSLKGTAANVFEVPDIASGQVSGPSPGPWTLSDVFKAGMDSNGRIAVAAEHYYQVTSGDNLGDAALQSELMNHTAITSMFKPFIQSINYLKNNASFSHIPYVLSETGSALAGNISFNGAFGACLWAVDFHLYGMSVGVSRIDGTQRPTVLHSLWTPNAIPGHNAPQVRANYYQQPYIADFISSSTAAQSVLEFPVKSDTLTAYGMYSGSTLERVALVNLVEWNASSGKARGSQSFAVDVPKGTSSVTVQRLTAAAGAEALGYDLGGPSQNITWAGEQWSYALDNGNGHVSNQASEKITVANNVAVVPVADSEAVIVFI